MRGFIHALTVCLLAAPLWATASSLDAVLARMNAAAPKFTGMSADLSKVTYTEVIDDKAEESGSVSLKKWKPGDLQVLIEIEQPDEKTVSFRGKKAEIFYPKIKTVQEYDLGKHGDLVDQFLLVGFGTPGKELAVNYDIKLVGEETVAGQKTHKLELTPKSAQRRERLRKLELWIAESGTHPVQQKFTQPSGDYTLITYSNVKLNPGLTEESIKLKLPKGVKREFPQR